MSETLAPARPASPPPTLESVSLFRMKVAALHDAPAPEPDDPVVVLIAGDNGGVIAVAPGAQIIALAQVRPGVRVRFFSR
ncbi:MAG: hypothetical protein GC189_10045 [Alphaproteobacteria bacterium]|nr:hypothetical protein [Alphaproteobacteria bacterium]